MCAFPVPSVIFVERVLVDQPVSAACHSPNARDSFRVHWEKTDIEATTIIALNFGQIGGRPFGFS